MHSVVSVKNPYFWPGSDEGAGSELRFVGDHAVQHAVATEVDRSMRNRGGIDGTGHTLSLRGVHVTHAGVAPHPGVLCARCR